MLSELLENSIKECPAGERLCKFYLMSGSKAICTVCGQSPEAGFCSRVITLEEQLSDDFERD